MVATIATQEIADDVDQRSVGKIRSGKAGAKARAEKLTSEERREIAKPPLAGDENKSSLEMRIRGVSWRATTSRASSAVIGGTVGPTTSRLSRRDCASASC